MKGNVFDCNLNTLKIKDGIDVQKFNILHGPVNIAGSMEENVKSLVNKNIYARSFVNTTNYFKYESDYYIEKNIFKSNTHSQKAYRKLLDEFMKEYDIFHFYFGTSILENYEDLKILKENGKKIVMSYLGSDCRLPSESIKYNPYYKQIYKQLNINENKIRSNLEICSEYIDFAIAGTVNSYIHLPHYYKNIYLNRVGLNLDYYVPIKVNNKVPLIVHAPTNKTIKGSEYIFSAIESLSKKYKLQFKLIENLSYQQAKALYEQADLVIDQLVLGEYGRLACECMALGKAVICYNNEHYMELNGIDNVPIINANPSSIEKVLEECIKNMDQVKKIGCNGREYAEKYHDISKNTDNLIAIYSQL